MKSNSIKESDEMNIREARIIQYTKILIGITGLLLFAIYVLGN